MSKILIIFAHPALEKSRVNKKLIGNIQHINKVTFNDLYEEYYDFNIDIEREKKLLLEHDLIVFQYPFFWYSTPALLKQWQDLVLEHGWAYGSKGTALVGKKMINIITTGGSSQAYTKESINQHSIREFLIPIEQTAKLCGMFFLPPYLIQGTHRLTEKEIEIHNKKYAQLLEDLSLDKFKTEELNKYETMNDFLNK